MVFYAENYDRGAWEFKITLTATLNYYGSYEIDSGATNTNYRHEFDLMMNPTPSSESTATRSGSLSTRKTEPTAVGLSARSGEPRRRGVKLR